MSIILVYLLVNEVSVTIIHTTVLPRKTGNLWKLSENVERVLNPTQMNLHK